MLGVSWSMRSQLLGGEFKRWAELLWTGIVALAKDPTNDFDELKLQESEVQRRILVKYLIDVSFLQ